MVLRFKFRSLDPKERGILPRHFAEEMKLQKKVERGGVESLAVGDVREPQARLGIRWAKTSFIGIRNRSERRGVEFNAFQRQCESQKKEQDPHTIFQILWTRYTSWREAATAKLAKLFLHKIDLELTQR
ncbi:MAG: hypothetical protein LLG04_07610 [Parachlamydia sp.]|nr:hypothetical protein [Parachlamydia sp.]